jgi:signal transduction histidine kinase
MWIRELFRSVAFRLAAVFALVVTASTCAVFAFVYWQVATSDLARLRTILVDEATKAAVEPTDNVERELARRLTRDLRQLEYVGLFNRTGAHLYGNVNRMPSVPIDGKAHLIEVRRQDTAGAATEPVIFVAAHRPDGGVLLLGRSLYEIYALRRSVLQALAIGILPTIVLALLAGTLLSLRASRRLQAIRDAINRIVRGDLRERLPLHRRPDDIDEVVRAVNLMLDQIIRLMEQIKTVGDNIAHDLRTPLSIMRARLERGLASSDKELRATSQKALADLDRALATVTALLRISEIESGVRRSAFGKLDLADVCRDVFEFYEPLAEAKSVTMRLEAPLPVPITGDADLLREAVANLVDNAIKFTPQGGAVMITAKEGPLIRVADNGPGVAPGDRDKIFKRFYRSAAHENIPGNGLGLEMAATIAELHGFSLRLAESTPGAAFEIAPLEKLKAAS